MNQHMTLMLTVKNAEDMPQHLWDDLDGHPFDDNGGAPDGDAWLPSTPLAQDEPGVQAILDAGYGDMVLATYFDSGREIVEWSSDWPKEPASEPLTEWFKTADAKDIDEAGWPIAQNLFAVSARYTSSGVIIGANPFTSGMEPEDPEMRRYRMMCP